ncbi:MAG TPA: hypothetical protein VGM20_11030 [Gemmatimonadales bacterium]|jgi:hypothetical protein
MLTIHIEIWTDESQIAQLCYDYWRLDDEQEAFDIGIADLAATCGIAHGKIPSTVQSSCTASLLDLECSSCGASYVLQSRSDFLALVKSPLPLWTCSVCKQQALEKAASAKQQREESTRELIASNIAAIRDEGAQFEQLSFTDAIYLLSVVRAGGSEDLSHISPLGEYPLALTPSLDWDKEILTRLEKHQLIHVHPDSPPGTILPGDDEHSWRYYPTMVSYVVPSPNRGPSTPRFVEALSAVLAGGNWPVLWRADARLLHRRLAIEEVLEFLRCELAAYDMALHPGEKTMLVVRELLSHYSIGQSFCFIWRAARDAAAYREKNGISRQQAANGIPGSIQRSIERAIANGWTISHFRRHRDAQETALAQILFTKVLKLANGGLETIPPAD